MTKPTLDANMIVTLENDCEDSKESESDGQVSHIPDPMILSWGSSFRSDEHLIQVTD